MPTSCPTMRRLRSSAAVSELLARESREVHISGHSERRGVHRVDGQASAANIEPGPALRAPNEKVRIMRQREPLQRRGKLRQSREVMLTVALDARHAKR